MKRDPFDQSLYVFISKRRNKIIILYYERCGFVLWYKRLDDDRFHWPKSEADVVTLSTPQLNWLLDGFNLNAMTPHTEINTRMPPNNLLSRAMNLYNYKHESREKCFSK